MCCWLNNLCIVLHMYCFLYFQTAMLNKHLSSLMAGLTAKVFRTYNASITLQQQLKELSNCESLFFFFFTLSFYIPYLVLSLHVFVVVMVTLLPCSCLPTFIHCNSLYNYLHMKTVHPHADSRGGFHTFTVFWKWAVLYKISLLHSRISHTSDLIVPHKHPEWMSGDMKQYIIPVF